MPGLSGHLGPDPVMGNIRIVTPQLNHTFDDLKDTEPAECTLKVGHHRVELADELSIPCKVRSTGKLRHHCTMLGCCQSWSSVHQLNCLYNHIESKICHQPCRCSCKAPRESLCHATMHPAICGLCMDARAHLGHSQHGWSAILCWFFGWIMVDS